MARRSSLETLSIVAMFALLISLAFPLEAQQAPSRLPSVIDERQLLTLKGNTHPQARSQNDRGEVATNLPMNRMVLLLKRGDAQESALQSAIRAMHDAKSPQYHRWLTPEQFGNLYGPSDADIAIVTQWLQGHGFHVNAVAKGRGTIEFSGSASEVEGAFHTPMHTYAVGAKQYVANAVDPSIPQALSPVVAGVLSLNNFEKSAYSRVMGKEQIVHTGPNGAAKLQPEANLSDGTHAVGPGDLWTIYNETPLVTAHTNPINGTGQTIAIVGRSDVSLDDITGFRTSFLPAPYASALPFTQINNGPDPGINGGDALEQTLDVEYSSAMAPAAQIDLVVSASTNTTDGVDLSAAYIVDNNLAPVMSTSYGSCEALNGTTGNAFYNSLWEQAAAQGITSMVAAGDNGSANCDIVGPSGSDSTPSVADEGLQVSGLASTPYNVAVGGNEFTDDSSTYWSPTSLSTPAPLTSALSYIPEEVWNESCSPLVCGNANSDIAAGSGGKSGCLTATFDSAGNVATCSGAYDEPDWQAGVDGLTADSVRHLPDVSLTASGHDGYLLCFNSSCKYGSVYVVGGTSASTPSFAGIMALVNQKTGSRQGQANYTLYRLAASEYGSAATPNTANLASCDATTGNGIGPSCIFQDVTTGTNAVPCDGGTLDCTSTTVGVLGVLSGYATTPGYDNATGLGSVNVTNLVNHWNDTTLTPTKTTLSLGAATSTFGQPVQVGVTVSPTTGSGTPTGTVALVTDAATNNGAGFVTLTSGAYNGTISSLPGGTYNVSARYAGDTSFASSKSSGSKITINPASSSAVLTFAATDAVTGAPFASGTVPYGSVLTATATIAGVAGQAAPIGNVTFSSASAALATRITDPTGVATYISTGNPLGAYKWTAAYAGDADYKAALSPSASFNITQAATTLRLLSNTSYVVGSNTATLTAIVLTDSLLENPTGNVAFSVNGTVANTAALTAYVDPTTGTSEAVATLTVPASALTVGSNKITASYAGDGNYAGANLATVLVGYSSTAPVNTIALTASAASVTVAQPVTMTATVTTGGIAATVGTVNFFDGTKPLASVQVVGNNPAKGATTGTAVLKTVLGTGTHNFTAVYVGILAAPTAVTSAVVPVAVAGSMPSATVLTAVPNASNLSNYDLTAAVSAYGFTAPTGAVDFAETTVVSDYGTATLDPKTAAQAFLAPTYATDGDPTGASPAQAVVADFNGDGIMDIATANASFSQSSMSVLIGNGDGTYKAPVLYAAGLFADAITTGDFNGDGNLDLAVTNQYNSTYSNGFVSIFLGNGDGTFQPQLIANLPGYPVNTVVADFNRDGILDLASLQYSPMQISVEFGNGDGTFGAPANYAVGYNDFSAYDMAAGDFNGDGAVDLVEVNEQDQSAEVFLNAGNGIFTQGKTLVTGLGPQWVSVADVNLDGKQDVIVSNYGDQTTGVFLGNGDGTFKGQLVHPVNGYASEIAVADIDGDGKPDLAEGYFAMVAAGAAPSIGILKGNGDGTFGAETDIPTGQSHGNGINLVDMNGDGTLDLLSLDINSQDPQNQAIATFLNVSQIKQVMQNVTIDGALDARQQLVATYSGDAIYNSSSSAGVFVESYGTKAAPAILWTPAATSVVGVPLGTNVLNATTTGSIHGSFAYTAQLGTAAPVAVTTASALAAAGTYTLTATFTPTDTADYSTATATRSLSVLAKTVPAILWTPATAWGIGVPLGTNVLNATADTIAGSFTYTAQLGTAAPVAVTTASVLAAAGTYTLTATFTPTDTADYSTATATRSVSIVAADFALEDSVSTLTITAGGSGTVSITAPALYGFTGQITLGNGVLPGGFTVTAAPATVAANGSSSITIQTSGLNPATAKLLDTPRWRGWKSVGAALSWVLILPLVAGRRQLLRHAVTLLLCLSIMSMAIGCGGEGYSNNSTVAITTSASSAASGSPVTLTAKLGGSHSSFSGKVTFYNGDTVLGTPVAVSGSTATLQTSSLPVGLNSLTATYTGDEHNASGNSAALPQLITGTATVQLTATSGSVSHATTLQVVLQ